MIKKLIVLCLFLVILGCGSAPPQWTVTLYNSTGTEIQHWANCSQPYSCSGGGYTFTSDGKNLVVSGILIMERQIEADGK